MALFICGRYHFDLTQPLVMGIVNVTPDSFSDGGRYFSAARAIEHGLQLRDEGAHILDIGGESTRPGSAAVSVEEELARVMPVLAGLRDANIALSVDSMKPAVMAAALSAGADLINDVRAFEAPGALEIIAQHGQSAAPCGICLMHMRGMPASMQNNPTYTDVVNEVAGYLRQRLTLAQQAGIAPERILIDPGFGFGKTLRHNTALFNHLAEFRQIAPLLVGLSRKSFLGALTGRTIAERLLPSVLSAVLALQAGANVVRVHDVKETVEAIQLWQHLNSKN